MNRLVGYQISFQELGYVVESAEEERGDDELGEDSQTNFVLLLVMLVRQSEAVGMTYCCISRNSKFEK